MTKFAAHIANIHCGIRMTPFFDTAAEAREFAASNKIEFNCIRETANWKEHQAWNAARVGNYASCPVAE
jgi:hypothetical protein